MSFFLAVEISLREIFAHKFRSFLSMLGIVLGVSSLVATMGLTAGIEKGTKAILQQIGGLERVQVRPKAVETEEVDFWMISPGRTLTDAKAIRESVPSVTHISPELRNWTPVTAGGEEKGYNVNGVFPDYSFINSHSLAAGRFISDLDIANANRVVVIGNQIAETLFPSASPESILGKTVLLQRIPYEVVGVFSLYEREQDKVRRERGVKSARPARAGKNRWDPFRQKNESVLTPFSTMFYDFKSGANSQHTQETVPLEQLAFRVGDLDFFRESIDQVRAVLDVTHRGVDDFDFDTREDMFSQMESSMRATRISGGLIAGISLLVGGIGITNIMLASISQRVREIGIRRAIGARASDIFVQILIESVAIALIGGALGVCAGIFLMQVLIWVAPGENMPVLTMQSVALSVAFAFLAGVFSGIYPAFKAAALDPITALRYE